MDKFLSDLTNPYFLLTAGLFALAVNLTSNAIWGVLTRLFKAIPAVLSAQKLKRSDQRAEFIGEYVAHYELRDGVHFGVTQVGIVSIFLIGFGAVLFAVTLWGVETTRDWNASNYIKIGLPFVLYVFAALMAGFGLRMIWFYLDRTQWVLEASQEVAKNCKAKSD